MNLGNKIMSMTDHTNDTTHMLLIELLLHYVAVKYLTALYYCLVLFPKPTCQGVTHQAGERSYHLRSHMHLDSIHTP